MFHRCMKACPRSSPVQIRTKKKKLFFFFHFFLQLYLLIVVIVVVEGETRSAARVRNVVQDVGTLAEPVGGVDAVEGAAAERLCRAQEPDRRPEGFPTRGICAEAARPQQTAQCLCGVAELLCQAACAHAQVGRGPEGGGKVVGKVGRRVADARASA